MYDLAEHTGDDLQLRIYLLAELKQKTTFFVYLVKTTPRRIHTRVYMCMQVDNVLRPSPLPLLVRPAILRADTFSIDFP